MTLGVFGSDSTAAVLDNLHAVSAGQPLKHKTLLPFHPGSKA
jgi:hypothetical protein